MLLFLLVVMPLLTNLFPQSIAHSHYPHLEEVSDGYQARANLEKTRLRLSSGLAQKPGPFALQSEHYEILNQDYELDLDWDPLPPPPPLEIVPLIISGPSSNRVDLVFFSDGYTVGERGKFISDALRLAEDISKNQTFNTVQPLLNFWAAFSPSKDSGVGVDGIPKDTPFGLYRVGTELRGVYYAYPDVGKAACDSLGQQCDYPILLGNDPLYGGLGGDFTVITASILNGPLVLRHELGHSILDVGEEYDGGYAYFGHNAAQSPEHFPWEQWLSDPLRVSEKGIPRVERSVMAMQAYPWTLLNTTTHWAVEFTSSGTYSRYSLQFSLSGLPHKGDLLVALDGVDLGWEPRPDVGIDRWFYNFYSPNSLTPGKHKLVFNLRNPERQGSAQLCSTEILEYGTEEEFVSRPHFYSLYPTFSDTNQTSYRPTNDDCLMRAVNTPNFCKVCLETLWIHLLRKINIVDSIHESCVPDPGNNSFVKVLALELLPLAQLRATPITPKESYTIVWKRNNEVLSEFTNKTRVELDGANSIGQYVVHVRFATEEIRLITRVVESDVYYNITSVCNS